VARGYVVNEGTGHEVGFQPYLRGDPSAATNSMSRPPGAPTMGGASPPLLDSLNDSATQHAIAVARQLSMGASGALPTSTLGGTSSLGLGRSGSIMGTSPDLSGSCSALLGGLSPPGSSPRGASPRGVSPPRSTSLPSGPDGAPRNRSSNKLNDPFAAAGLLSSGIEVGGGSGSSSVVGDDELCGGSREQEMEHEEIAFDVYKVRGGGGCESGVASASGQAISTWQLSWTAGHIQ
jgi:hypothetical protein